MSLTPWDNWTAYGTYLTGNSVSNRMSLQEYEVGVIYTFSRNAAVRVLYRDLTMGRVDQLGLIRAQVDYGF